MPTTGHELTAPESQSYYRKQKAIEIWYAIDNLKLNQ